MADSRLVWVFACALVVQFAGNAPVGGEERPKPSRHVVREIQLVDASGKTRLLLGVDGGRAGVFLYNANGKRVAEFVHHQQPSPSEVARSDVPAGETRITIFDSTGSERLSLGVLTGPLESGGGVTGREEPCVALFGRGDTGARILLKVRARDRVPQVYVRPPEEPKPALSVRDSSGNSVLEVWGVR